MALSLAGIGVHGECRQCTRGLGACASVFVIMQQRCGCGVQQEHAGRCQCSKWLVVLGCVFNRLWLRPVPRNSMLERVRGNVLCAACLDSFVERSQWLHWWSVPWLRHHLQLYGQANLVFRVACATCGCLAASNAAAWPHTRSGSAPNFAYVFVYVLNEDNL